MKRWPNYAFAVFVGPIFTKFAWWPTRTWYGRWIWLRRIECRRVIKKSFLDGPNFEFFCYNDVSRDNAHQECTRCSEKLEKADPHAF